MGLKNGFLCQYWLKLAILPKSGKTGNPATPPSQILPFFLHWEIAVVLLSASEVPY